MGICCRTIVSSEQRGDVVRGPDVHSDLSALPEGTAASVAAGAAEAMLLLDATGRILFANAAAERLIGIPAPELCGHSAEELVTGIAELAGEVVSRRFQPPLDSAEGPWDGPEPRLERGRGTWIPVRLRMSAVTGPDGPPFCAVSIAPTARNSTSAETGRQRIEQALAAVMREGTGGAIVVDVDHFELVNEGFGRAAGDYVLTGLDLAISDWAATDETVARLEADRFAIVTPRNDIRNRGEHLLQQIREERIDIGPTVFHLTASAGIYRVSGPVPVEPERALLSAERALRLAKQHGGDRCLLADIGPGAVLDVGWNDRIRTAIENGGLIPHFQPILDLQTSQISHFELLARLRTADGETLAAGEFIPVAERLGMIGAIDRWAVRTATRTLGRFAPNPAGPKIAINASGHSVGSTPLIECLRGELERNSVLASRLIVEVTETAAIGSIHAATDFAEELHRLGVKLALDDFGSGFGTFYYLKHMPLDQVKIDGEFIQDITASPTDQVFVRSLVEMAQGLGIRTVAEYVQDQPSLDCVRTLGVDYAQGMHIGPPRPLLA
jgi:diguanylate cyclase (GGDEF)-like protein/PAS domain S-box-containing protein